MYWLRPISVVYRVYGMVLCKHKWHQDWHFKNNSAQSKVCLVHACMLLDSDIILEEEGSYFSETKIETSSDVSTAS